jgi:hypothetical protein
MYQHQLEVFEELNGSLPREMTSKWAEEPVHATIGEEGTWQSPLHETESPGKFCLFAMTTRHKLFCSVSSFQQTLRQEQDKECANAHVPASRIGASQWVVTAIELENAMYVHSI